MSETNHPDQAVGWYRKAIALDGSNIFAHGQLGLAMAGQGKIDDAIKEFQIVLKARPNDAEMHCNLGILLESQGKTDEAIEHYRQALQIKPDNKKAGELLDAALAKQKK
jgi:superkiller protein 3